MHRHRPARIFQGRPGHPRCVKDSDNDRHQRDIHRRRPEYPGESMAQPGLARHPLGGASMAPRHRSGVTGDQEEGGNGLEGPRQPLCPGLINERILPTEGSVAVGHRSGQPVAQHDENHPRHAVEVHCRVADRALGHTQKVPVTRRCGAERGMRRPRWRDLRQGRPPNPSGKLVFSASRFGASSLGRCPIYGHAFVEQTGCRSRGSGIVGARWRGDRVRGRAVGAAINTTCSYPQVVAALNAQSPGCRGQSSPDSRMAQGCLQRYPRFAAATAHADGSASPGAFPGRRTSTSR